MVALEEAFKGSIMVGKFPSCVLNIELPCEIIDVNVHPSKLEVRFINERPVFDAIYHAVKSSLMKYDSRKKASFKKETAFNEVQNKFNPFNNAPAILNKPVVQSSKNDFVQNSILNRYLTIQKQRLQNLLLHPKNPMILIRFPMSHLMIIRRLARQLFVLLQSPLMI